MYKIYKLTSKTSGKSYIGKIKRSIKTRLVEHASSAKHTKNANSKLHNAIRKYGINDFEVEILHETSSKVKLNLLEEEAISKHNTINSGYNIQAGGNGGDTSKYIDYSTRRSYSGKGNPMYGRSRKGEGCKKWKIITPENEIVVTSNLPKFCQNHNLIPQCMRTAAYRNIKYKGYSVFPSGNNS